MPREGSKVQEFLDAYCSAFEAFDVAAVADLFSYPCQIAGGEPEVTVTTLANRDVWLPQIERLLAAYRAIGVHSAEVRELRAVELTPRLAQAAVRWALLDQEREAIYDFDACYTLADFGQGMRITAIAHNETPRLRAAIDRRRLK
jgi:hypothetical protein